MSESPKDGSPSPESSLEVDTHLLRCLADARPVGRNKHFQMIKLQAEMHRRMGSWTPVEEIWRKLAELYELDKLDEREASSSESLPESPRSLSPRLPSTSTMLSERPPAAQTKTSAKSSPSKTPAGSGPSAARDKTTNSRARVVAAKSASLSPPPDDSGAEEQQEAEEPPRGATGSAAVINSGHFKQTFDIPYFAQSSSSPTKRPRQSSGRTGKRLGVHEGMSSADEDDGEQDENGEDGNSDDEGQRASRRTTRGNGSDAAGQTASRAAKTAQADRGREEEEMSAWEEMIYDRKRTGQVEEDDEWPEEQVGNGRTSAPTTTSDTKTKHQGTEDPGASQATPPGDGDDNHIDGEEDDENRNDEDDDDKRDTSGNEDDDDDQEDGEDEEEEETPRTAKRGKAQPAGRGGEPSRTSAMGTKSTTSRQTAAAKRKRAKAESSSEDEAPEQKPRRGKRRG